MTPEEIHRIASIFTAAGRKSIPVPISEWRECMAARIGKATIKDGKLSPVRKGSKIQKTAKAKKAARVVKGLKANVASSKARKG